MRTGHREDDTPLVEACIGRDAAAWACLVKRYSGLISSSIANRLRRCGFRVLREEAEDIGQDVIASIWEERKLEQVRNRQSIAYWLSIVSGNAAIEHMRRKASGGRHTFIGLEDMTDAAAAADPEQPAKKELSEMVERAIGSLPSKEQLVIKLNILYDMKYRDIARMLKMPKGTVSSYIKRGKERLKKVLKDFSRPE